MIRPNEHICPNCGGQLQKRGRVKRVVRGENSNRFTIYIRRFSCKKCGKWHRSLPKSLYPYKQYLGYIIDGFRDGTYFVEDEQFDFYPCEMTVKRWNAT